MWFPRVRSSTSVVLSTQASLSPLLTPMSLREPITTTTPVVFTSHLLGQRCVDDPKQIHPVLNVFHGEHWIDDRRSDGGDQGAARRGPTSHPSGSVRKDKDERFAALEHVGRVLGLVDSRQARERS